MASDLISAGGILCVVRPNVNYSTVIVQFKVMSGFLVRKTHLVIAMCIHHGVVILLTEGDKRHQKESGYGLFHESDYLP